MTIQLIDGRTWDSNDLSFDPVSYHFTSKQTGEDLTDNIYRHDKLSFVNYFDVEKENYRLSAEDGGGAKYGNDPLQTSTAQIFTDQIINDPLGAPIAALDKGFKQLTSSYGIKVIAGGAIGLILLYIIARK